MSLHLFQGFGVEIEYMIVDKSTLSVLPIADKALKYATVLPGTQVLEESGSFPSEVRLGPIAWSNELTAHVLEFKVAEPVPSLIDIAAAFQESVRTANKLLNSAGGCLLPTGMHPWMDPSREMKLWPHERSEVYSTFDRIFDCRGHGWSNLQAVHLNLPFDGDDEFGRLHAAIRAILPILPALTASSPVMEDKLTGLMDNRVDVYRFNCKRVPSVTGRVIPEPVYTELDYEEQILQRIYGDMTELDPDGQLRHEWVNARGCTARFERSAIEIRVMDTQECPAADVAICGAVSAVLRAIALGDMGDIKTFMALDTAALERILLAVVKDGDRAVIPDRDYARLLGWRGGTCTAGDLWRDLIGAAARGQPGWEQWRPWIETIMTQGCLARRITRALANDLSRPNLQRIYGQLRDCLEQGRSFKVKV